MLADVEGARMVKFLKSAANDEKVLDSPGVDIPMISLTRYPYPEYHTDGDNMDIIDKNTLKAVGQTVLEVIYSEI